MNLLDVVILSAARTPIGKFRGGLANVPAPRLGAVAVKAAVERAGVDPVQIEEVLMGQVIAAGSGQCGHGAYDSRLRCVKHPG